MNVRKLVAEDPEVASFRIKNDRAIQTLQPRRDSTRRRELHVSDFTKSDTEFCARKVLVRWWRGDSREFTSAIQRDGKFRENKWHEQFEAAKIVISYQPEFRLGLLVGHPDWVLDWGFGPRVIDLTGQDRRLDFIQLARHTKMKKRQVLLYLVMSDIKRGFVVLEDKGSSEFNVVAVERSVKEEEALVWRVVTVTQAVESLPAEPTDIQVVRALRIMPRCGLKSCHWCAATQDHQLLAETETVPETLSQDQPGPLQTAEIRAPGAPASAAYPLPSQAPSGASHDRERSAEELLDMVDSK